MTPELKRLVELAKLLPPMTKEERDLQHIDFAYGNLACTTNHKPNRKAFETIVLDKYGWSKERFDEWAKDKEWW